MGIRRFIYTILGPVAACATLLAIWPGPIVTVAREFGLQDFDSVAQFRILALFVFVVAMALRFRINPGKQPSRQTLALEQFASGVGGALTEERRKPTKAGWEGGPTVRWVSRGVPITLNRCTDAGRNNQTRFQADVRLSRQFQFHLLPETFATKALLSPKLWNFVLAGVKTADGEGMENGVGKEVAERMAFMGKEEIKIGDPLFDAAFLVKGDSEALAREFFGEPDVSHALRELNGWRKGWDLSLLVMNPPDGYQLTLSVPGAVSDLAGLEFGRKVLEAGIRRLADRGMLATASQKTA